ncbi:MAG: FAD:protein FMN transferase, partial [Calditrichia bacterium]
MIFCPLLIIILYGCQGGEQPLTRTNILLGTFVTITDYDYGLDKSQINPALDSAFAAIATIEAMTNPYDSTSAIGEINSYSDSRNRFKIDEPLHSILAEAMAVSRRSNGAFEFTLWPVFKLWNFGENSGSIPSHKEISEAKKLVDYRKLILKPGELQFEMGGMQIDLGGIVKGFAVEAARKIMKGYGLKNFIIDAGGNLGIEWHKEEPVQIYVRHPRKDGEFWAQFPVRRSLGIATSGDYQYYFIKDGKRYHHIIDPANGYPAEPTVSCTIVAENAILADGMSTAVFVMGPDRGSKFIESNPEIEGIMVFPLNGKFHTFVSGGLKAT